MSVSLPVSIIAYIVYAMKYRQLYLKGEDVDLDTGIREYDEDEALDDNDKRQPGVWGWIKYAWNS